MARYDDITFIEQHIEKGALLLCVMLLVGAVGQWFWHSPRKIDGVRPDEIDKKLADQARELKKKADEAIPKGEKPSVYGQVIAGLQKGASFEPMIDLAGGHPAREIDEEDDLTKPIDLAEVESKILAPEKPLAWAGYRIPHKDPDKLADVPGAHVGLFYPWRQVKKDWIHVFKDTRIMPRLVALGVRVQVQEASGNGEFGPERDLATVSWQKPSPDGKVIKVPELPPYKQNAKEVNEAIALLEAPLIQGLILRPNYWPILHAPTQEPVDWRNNLPKSLWAAAKEPLAKQFEQERILIWFHHDGLASRTSYRYKAQLLLLNPLLTHDNLVDPETPEHAQKATLVTPWSPWSEPVFVPKTTSFLLTGSNPTSRPPYLTVTVFARALGKQVSRRFKVFPGQPIGGPHTDADFSTGAVVVDLNFHRYVSARTKTPEMLYLDDNGQLRSRLYMIDKAKFDAMKRLAKPGARVPKPGRPGKPVPLRVHEGMFESTMRGGTPAAPR